MELGYLGAAAPWAQVCTGLLFGTLHACDADHVMTVTSIARSGVRSRRAIFGYGMRWSLGHAGALIGAGTLLAACGWNFPWLLGAAAESAVAIVLCLLGAHLLAQVWRASGAAGVVTRARRVPAHGVVGLGVLHGLAGAAPVIALIPLAGRLDPWFACIYLGCFSLGVILAMLVIAGLLGGANQGLRAGGARLERALNSVVGVAALLVGMHLLVGVCA